MVAEATIAFVFAIAGLVSTVILIGLAVYGIAKLDDLRGVLDDADDAESDRRADADPLETLRERYARGDVTDEEFERKVERLLETGGEFPGTTERSLESE